ncbi:MAG: tripartite tricarboxylate transporter substrate binding protein, partial [Alphaproteobacteria bacterium]|nr:tripartite tricarboxylate transporter substrate binding protein [Alphaproteobacteria bacterium]
MSRLLLGLLLAAAAVAPAGADSYPNHPIRWVVGYPAGGTTDIIARIIAQAITPAMGQQVIVDNKPGAGNNIGTDVVLKSAPDGYTVLLVNPANAINATLYAKLPFDFLADWAPIAGIARVPNVMEVNPTVPAKTIPEFIAYAKANPGKINLASSGNGTSVHLSGELFKSMAGVDLLHIPYKGSAPALNDLIA